MSDMKAVLAEQTLRILAVNALKADGHSEQQATEMVRRYFKALRPTFVQPEAARTAEGLAKAAHPFVDGFTYDPGHSDLDNEQPIHVRVTLGDWRRLNFILGRYFDAERNKCGAAPHEQPKEG